MKKTYKTILAIFACTASTFGAILLWNFHHDILAAIAIFAAVCCSCIANDREDREYV